jgi:hypothetical protein
LKALAEKSAKEIQEKNKDIGVLTDRNNKLEEESKQGSLSASDKERAQ